MTLISRRITGIRNVEGKEYINKKKGVVTVAKIATEGSSNRLRFVLET